MGESLPSSPAMYMTEEKLCLKWNDFQENTISSFGKLRDDKEFSDVTLACEDGQQVEAHKLVLASSSTFFMNLLNRNKHPHPLIYMSGMKSEDLVAIVDFLYHGEANIYQESLDSFLAVAEELRLKGLSGNQPSQEEESGVQNIPKKQLKGVEKKEQVKQYDHDEAQVPVYSKLETYSQSPPEGSVAVVDPYTVAADLQDLDEQINSMMEPSENLVGGSGLHANRKLGICKVCGKEGHQANIKAHIEANHITGASHPCNICGKTSRSRNALRLHKTKEHSF